jgi:ABC-type nitrate/sulfonate/bicarbonate transport system permease component
VRRALLGLTGLLAFGAVLEAAPRLGLVRPEYLPPVSRIVAALVDGWDRPQFRRAVVDTLMTWTIGLNIAIVAGVVLGVLIGAVPVLRAATASTIEFLRPIPSVALVPLAVLLYGATMPSTLMLVVYASFWQVLIQVLHGVSDVDPVARDTAHAYGLGRVARIRYLVWPTAAPYAATGMRLAASVALILTITGEMVIGSPGLGREIALAQSSDAIPQMYALIMVAGFIGLIANVLARAAERQILAWHPAMRAEMPA